ncbi:unnamed protein product, partial [Brassica oleracea]
MATRNREIRWQQQEMQSVAPTNAKIEKITKIHLKFRRVILSNSIVYDKDTFTSHDKMGDAQIVIKPFLEVHKLGLQELPGGTEIKRVLPTRE